MSITIIDCQEAATYLGVSVKTIRRWAQEGKLHGKKVGSRGDWRFTHTDLDKMIHSGDDKYDAIADFLRKNAIKISEVACENYCARLEDNEGQQKRIKKNKGLYADIIKTLANSVYDIEYGKRALEKLSKQVAEQSLRNGLSIEETIDSSMTLKQTAWDVLEQTDLLLKLSTMDLQTFFRRIAIYYDTIASHIAFAYQHEYEKNQLALKHSEEKFSNVFRSGPVAYSIIRFSTGKWVDINDQFLKLTGYSRNEVIGSDMLGLNMLPEKDAAASVNKRRATLEKTGRLPRYYITIKTKSGELKRLRGESVMVKIDGEDHAVTMHIDVTDKAKAEERDQYLAALSASVADAVISADNRHHIVSWNKGAEKLYGWKEQEVIGKPIAEAIDPQFISGAKNTTEMRELLKKNGTWSGEVLQKDKNGRKLTVLSSMAVMRNKDDKIIGRVAVNHDITQRKIREQEIKDREERYRTLFDSIEEGFCIVELIYDKKGHVRDCRFIEVNKVFEKIAKMKNPVGKTLLEMEPKTPRKWLDIFERVAKTGKGDLSVEYSESRDRWYDVHSMCVGGPGSQLVAQLFQDVTEKKRAAEETEAAATKVINTLEAISEIFFQVDANWNVLLVNKWFEQLVHRSREDIIGANLWKSFPDPNREKALYYQKFQEAMKTREAVKFVDFFEPLGIWFDISVYPAEGGGISVFTRDITEQKLAAESRAQYTQLSAEHDELIRLTKAKDEFIGIASHQLRTPATAVKQYIGIMLSGMAGELSESQLKFLETAYHSNERQLKLINDLLKTAQIDAAAFQLNSSTQNVASILLSTMSALEPTLESRNQRLVFTDESNGAEANVDPIEIDLVFSNLLDNASKYSTADKTIAVKVCKNNKMLEISITDEGIGISREDQSKIFDKFTRINNEMSASASGNGLGLYWVKHIVELHNGTITVESTPGKGSIFTVGLPL